jgi:hypothetical protein
MKMLGQDLHTQEEFDTFYENEFKPLTQKVATVTSKVKNACFLALVALVVSIGSAAYIVASSVSK